MLEVTSYYLRKLRWSGIVVVVGVGRVDRPAFAGGTGLLHSSIRNGYSTTTRQSAPSGGGGPLCVSTMVVGLSAPADTSSWFYTCDRNTPGAGRSRRSTPTVLLHIDGTTLYPPPFPNVMVKLQIMTIFLQACRKGTFHVE